MEWLSSRGKEFVTLAPPIDGWHGTEDRIIPILCAVGQLSCGWVWYRSLDRRKLPSLISSIQLFYTAITSAEGDPWNLSLDRGTASHI